MTYAIIPDNPCIWMLLSFPEFNCSCLISMPTFGSLSLTLVYPNSSLWRLSLELEVLLLLGHAVSHECSWVTCCSTLLCRTWSVQSDRLSILVPADPLILLLRFISPLGNRLVRSLCHIIAILWIFDGSSSWYWILGSLIGHIWVSIRLIWSLPIKGYVGISWWHITHLISHDHFITSSCD